MIHIMEIRLKTIEDVKKFVEIVSSLQIEADVHTIDNGRHVVPAESILGLFSLDLNKKLVVEVHSDSNKFFEFQKECEVL